MFHENEKEHPCVEVMICITIGFLRGKMGNLNQNGLAFKEALSSVLHSSVNLRSACCTLNQVNQLVYGIAYTNLKTNKQTKNWIYFVYNTFMHIREKLQF